MKRLLIICLAAFMCQSCILVLMDILDPSEFTDYYDPEIESSSDTLSTNFGFVGEIPNIGDTCWFKIKYEYVPTKFEPIESRKAFRYIIDVEGMEPGEPVIINGWEKNNHFDVPCENWYENVNYYTFMIYFVVPENQSENDRIVKAKVSFADDHKQEKADWLDWQTVLHLKQEGTKSANK